jgi:hypothetical protein
LNPNGENFIYNFDYYINKKILNNEIIEKINEKNYELKQINGHARELIIKQSELVAKYSQYESDY